MMMSESEPDGRLAARKLLLEKTYEQFDRNPTSTIRLLRDGAKQMVPGRGSFNPAVIFVGEAPGSQEDREGRPFVGLSGKLLDKFLLRAGIENRDDIWITNVVKYRPEGNRTPYDDEIQDSLPLLRREAALVAGDATKLFVGLGAVACSAIAGAPISVGRSHSSVVSLKAGWKLFVTFHPAAGLRSTHIRTQTYTDFERLAHILRTHPAIQRRKDRLS